MLSRVMGILVISGACLAAVGAEELESGLPVGKGPTPFHPLNITGKSAGQKNCLV